MTPQNDSREFTSVDWDQIEEKRDWSATFWTAAAILVILLGFVGGMVFRTSLTGGPDHHEEVGDESRTVHVAEQQPGN